MKQAGLCLAVPESPSRPEELIIRLGVITLAALGVVRLVVKDSCDLYEEFHKKMKRWRRRAS
jgi:hypothetical protein